MHFVDRDCGSGRKPFESRISNYYDKLSDTDILVGS